MQENVELKDIDNMTTLCYIEENGAYLCLNRPGDETDPNSGKCIGIGGHFKEGESPEDCLLREVKEEAGVTLTTYSYRGVVTFVSDKWGTEYMHLYTATGYEGEIDLSRDNGEGKLVWIKKEEILNQNLWEGDRIFLRKLLAGEEHFNLKLVYQGDELVQYEMFKYT